MAEQDRRQFITALKDAIFVPDNKGNNTDTLVILNICRFMIDSFYPTS